MEVTKYPLERNPYWKWWGLGPRRAFSIRRFGVGYMWWAGGHWKWRFYHRTNTTRHFWTSFNGGRLMRLSGSADSKDTAVVKAHVSAAFSMMGMLDPGVFDMHVYIKGEWCKVVPLEFTFRAPTEAEIGASKRGSSVEWTEEGF